MAIKIGHASLDEKRGIHGGAAGDQTGGEVYTRTWYNANWNVVLRPKSADLAEKSAKACEAACANNKIGYDQYSRNTLYRYAKLVDFDIAGITDECECDCSSLMHVCAIAGGAKLSYGVNGLVTWNMVDAFIKSGDYEKLTDSKYLLSGDFLRRGDILVRESGHTAMALENGAKSGSDNPTPSPTPTPAANTVTVKLPTLRNGSVGASVRSLQQLLTAKGYALGMIDGEFGPKTENALRRCQKAMGLLVDGICGQNSWTAILTK